MPTQLSATTDTLAIAVTVVATLVVVGLLAAAGYLLESVRELRRQADALAQEAQQLLAELGETVRQAGVEVERVDRMVGSAEAISDAVGSASRLVGGVVAEPLIKVVAFGSGLARVARIVRGGGPAEVSAPSRDNGRPVRGGASSRARGSLGRRSRPVERPAAALTTGGKAATRRGRR
jgi:hypothetical protein